MGSAYRVKDQENMHFGTPGRKRGRLPIEQLWGFLWNTKRMFGTSCGIVDYKSTLSVGPHALRNMWPSGMGFEIPQYPAFATQNVTENCDSVPLLFLSKNREVHILFRICFEVDEQGIERYRGCIEVSVQTIVFDQLAHRS